MAEKTDSKGGEGRTEQGAEGSREGREGVEPQSLPASMDVMGTFSTIALIEGLRMRYAVPSFIRDTFFGTRSYEAADVIAVETYKGGKGLAPFVLPLEGQVVGRRRPFQRSLIEAPTIAPSRVITLREAGAVGWGETAYNYKTVEERVADLIANDTQDMDDEIARTEEFMCASCMFDGKIPIHYRTKTDVLLDYGFTNTTTLAKFWTDATANPLDDLAAAQQGLNANGYSGSLAVYSPEAWKALWGNVNVQNQFKNIINPITSYSFPEGTPAGVARVPSFTYPTIDNVVYSATYTDKTGAVKSYVPKGAVIVCSPAVKNRVVYAQVSQIEQSDGRFHTYLLDRVPKLECNVNRNFHLLTLSARPVPVPVDLMAWTVIKGTVA
jgi:Phage major capsid protein E